jgi:caa(3)-type oxidase subunit IV
MSSHAAAHADAHAAAHAHPSVGTYFKIGLTLFLLTALEVGAYEVVHRGQPAGFAHLLEPVVVPVLLLLSAVKFALVAMFYMHLKSDEPLLSSVFVFSLVIAAVVITALMLLFAYMHHVSPTKVPGA